MYLHLGQDVCVLKSSVIAIFDIDNSSSSYLTREYLNAQEKKGNIVPIGDDIPKSFVLCEENGKETVYLSQLAPSTLLKRSSTPGFDLGI